MAPAAIPSENHRQWAMQALDMVTCTFVVVPTSHTSQEGASPWCLYNHSPAH